MLEAARLEFEALCRIGSVSGVEILRYFAASELEIRWIRLLDSGGPQKTWALLAKPTSRALTEGFGLHYEVLVLCSAHLDFQPRLLDHRRDVERALPTDGRLQDNISIVLCEDPALAEKLRRHEDATHVLLPVNSAQIEEGLRSGSPSEAFRGLLQQHLYARDAFDRTGPVEGSDFFGRIKLLQDIALQLERGSHVGLYGLRKVGKTSVIKSLLARQARLCPSLTLVHIDLWSVPPSNRTHYYLLHAIAVALSVRLSADELRRLSPGILGRPGRFDAMGNEKEFERAFDSDIRALLAMYQATQRRLVIVMDEIEQLFPSGDVRPGFSGYDSFIGYMRGLSQGVGPISLMVVGVNPNISEAQFLGKRQNPLFAFFTTRYAPPMTLDEIREMIRVLGRSSGARFEHDAVDLIYDYLGGHPFLTRRLCSLAIREQIRPVVVTRDCIAAKAREFLRQDTSNFAEMVSVVREYYPEEFAVLHKIACDGGVTTESVGRQVLSHLEGYQLVVEDRGLIRIKNQLMNEWLTGLSTAEARPATETAQSTATAELTVTKETLQALVKDVELGLRHLIRARLDARWAGKAEERIRIALGETAVTRAYERQSVSLRRYWPGDAARGAGEILDFLYIGDLLNIITSNEWQEFREIFKDKKEIERILAIIAPCRTELQHFRDLPKREALRAFLAAEDLLDKLKR